MKGSINRAVLEQTSFDSAQPSGAATLVHRFAREGRYSVALAGDGDEIVETRTIFVERSGSDPGGPPVPRALRADAPDVLAPDSVVIDLTGNVHLAGHPAPPDAPSIVTLGAGGYAAFSAPAGKARRVVVTRIESGEQEMEFDSSRMQTTDVFAVTLIRPGTYAMRNALGGEDGRVVVTYPVVGTEPYRPAEPMEVECREGSFEPSAVKIGPGQGIIFHAAAECRITVDLLEPDDGPGEPEGKGRRRPLMSRRLQRPPTTADPDRPDPGEDKR